jgi:hypothetical protein
MIDMALFDINDLHWLFTTCELCILLYLFAKFTIHFKHKTQNFQKLFYAGPSTMSSISQNIFIFLDYILESIQKVCVNGSTILHFKCTWFLNQQFHQQSTTILGHLFIHRFIYFTHKYYALKICLMHK